MKVKSVDQTHPLSVWPGHAGNWGRWPNDRGTLNLITPEVTLRGVRSVRSGETIPCARQTAAQGSLDGEDLFEQTMTHVRPVADNCCSKTMSAADKLVFRVHNLDNTHIDALAHIGYNGKHFNGYDTEEVVGMNDGAIRLDVTPALGVVTRGRLIDVARGRGVPHLQPGDCVQPKDIADHLDLIEPGDAVILRTGATLVGGLPSEHDVRGLWSGIHPDCVELLAARDISLIGGDATEPGPTPVPEQCSRPFHVMCLAVFGIHIIHGMDLELLARRCAELGRTDFLFVAAALNVPRATGSPITPLAIL